MDGYTVLIAEDDKNLRSLLRDLLQMEGYRVVEAGDALEAMKALDARRMGDQFAVVLLDVTQPYDGLEILRHMAAQRDTTPVVALSVSEARLDSAVEAGAQVGFLKPFEVDELLDCVRQLAA